MQIAIRSKNVEVTPAIRDYIEKKIGRLTKYVEGLESAQVTLGVERGRHLVEVTIPHGSLVLRGEEGTGDMYGSIDLVTDKLERQLEKYRTRLQKKYRAADLKETAAVAQDENRVVKTKRFPVKPISTDEALLRLDLVGHDFYAFLNSETDAINVVYRRRDGNYGLLEPDL